MKAVTGATLMGDHERKALAARAPYFHVLDGTAELQGHNQFTDGWQRYRLPISMNGQILRGLDHPESKGDLPANATGSIRIPLSGLLVGTLDQ
jgi:hypothetical protein